MKLIVATTNPGKLRELERLLRAEIELLPWSSLDIDPPEETGTTFLENAIIKARAGAAYGLPTIADDSGLEVDALGGRPGVHSARFAGPGATDAENNTRLIEELNRLGAVNRTARFVSAVALALPDGHLVTATGTIEGRIVDTPRGANGFGYDPHFEVHDAAAPEATGRTLAELPLSQKNEISHRARAYRNLIAACSKERNSHPIIAALGATPITGGQPT